MAPRVERAVETSTRFDRRRASDRSADASRAPAEAAPSRKRRATRDGREPLVIYMLPASIKALKIAAIEQDSTASAIVAEAVTTWLRANRVGFSDA